MSSGRYHGSVFMYPCAGDDRVEVFRAYADRFDTLLFVDISYQFLNFEPPSFDGWHAMRDTFSLEGPSVDEMDWAATEGRRYRKLAPAWWRCRYQQVRTGNTVELVLRRGFGQYALRELAAGQLGMFLHRGDSMGESGSGTKFLANARMRHEPLSNLLDVIKTKLSVPARIGSDGSNTRIRQLVQAASGVQDIVPFRRHGLFWEPEGTLPGRSSRFTVVWQVTPQQPAEA